jgi:hypothetical protein
MPDKVERTFRELLSEVLVSTGVSLAVKKFTEKASDKVAEISKAKFEEQQRVAKERADLLEDLRLMEQKNPRSTEHIWRRHKEATAKCQENRMVSLLCKIPCDENEGRIPTLEFLNGVSDERFWQALNLLEHDAFWQWTQRFRYNASKMTKRDFDGLVINLQKGIGWTEEVTDNTAGQVALVVGKFTEGIEALRRKVRK